MKQFLISLYIFLLFILLLVLIIFSISVTIGFYQLEQSLLYLTYMIVILLIFDLFVIVSIKLIYKLRRKTDAKIIEFILASVPAAISFVWIIYALMESFF